MVKNGICTCFLSATLSVVLFALLIILIFPVPVSAEGYKMTEEKLIEDKSKKTDLQEELPDKESPGKQIEEFPDKKSPGKQIIDDFEITIKPKVDDTIKSECIHPPLSVKYGLTPNWEFTFRLNTFLNNPLRGETRNGVSDVSIGTKYHWERFFQPFVDAITAFSIQIPAGNGEDISDEYTHYRPELKFIKRVPAWNEIQFSAIIKMDILSGSSESIETLNQDPLDNSLTLTIGTLFPVAPFKYTIEAEWVTTEIDRGNQNIVYLTSGVFYDLPEKKYPWMRGAMQLGLGVRIGLNDTEDNFAFFARLDWDFPLKMRFKKGSKKENHAQP